MSIISQPEWKKKYLLTNDDLSTNISFSILAVKLSTCRRAESFFFKAIHCIQAAAMLNRRRGLDYKYVRQC